MGKLRNTSTNNTFGGGKEQIYTSDSGKTYRIRNTSTENVYGGGKEKIITEECGSAGDGLAELLAEIVPWWVWIIIVVVILIIQKTCF
jgi:hypothetical protein